MRGNFNLIASLLSPECNFFTWICMRNDNRYHHHYFAIFSHSFAILGNIIASRTRETRVKFLNTKTIENHPAMGWKSAWIWRCTLFRTIYMNIMLSWLFYTTFTIHSILWCVYKYSRTLIFMEEFVYIAKIKTHFSLSLNSIVPQCCCCCCCPGNTEMLALKPKSSTIQLWTHS